MSQAFYRKWRPQKWDEVVAQEHVIQTLRNSVRTGHTAHAYLLAGPRGTGKTTTARLLAKALNCLDEDTAKRPCDACLHCKAIDEGRFLDLIEIDAASNTSVDDVRDLRDKINFSPSQGRYKVYIIDEVHMLSTAAFNALLKTLEEPPPHAVFVLATTEVHKIPATILSRVQRYEFRRIPVKDIAAHLKKMAAEEKIEVDEDALVLIARQATGAMRDAISLLDQLASGNSRVTLQDAQAVLGTATNRLVIDLVDAVLRQDAGQGMTVVLAALDAGTDPRQFARQVVEYLRGLMLVKMGNAAEVDATAEARQEMASTAARFELPRLLEAIRVFNAAAADARSAWHPGLALEMAVAETAGWEEPAVRIESAVRIEPAARIEPAVNKQPATNKQPAAATENTEKKKITAQVPPGWSETPEEQRARLAAQEQIAVDTFNKIAVQVKGKKPEAAVTIEPAADKQPAKGQPAKGQPAASEAPAAQPDSPRAITQNDIQQNWVRIRAQVKQRNHYTEAALNSCRFMLKDSGTLVLTFSTEVVKAKMETEENIKLLREALQAILGVRLNVKCALASNKSTSPTDLEVDGDGIVGTALDLGGKIVYDE